MKKDFSNYRFRASQSSKLLVGTIGLTDKEKITKNTLLKRKIGFANGDNDENGKPYKALTDKMEFDLKELIEKEKDKTLPKTMQTELRKIHRMETYKRNFPFTNAYVQKGLQQEQEAITTYQLYLQAKGKNVLFKKNTERIENDWFSGEPDLGPFGVPILKWKEGWDTKCSWNLSSFPFETDELDPIYESQNQVYIDLTGAEKWTTVYVLVNCGEHQLNNEKLKHWYANQSPDESDEDQSNWLEYIRVAREVERMMIFDYDRFIERYPYHQILHTRDEWYGEGYDIPLEERVIEKVSYRNDDFIKELKERITIARKYLNEL